MVFFDGMREFNTENTKIIFYCIQNDITWKVLKHEKPIKNNILDM